MAFDLFQSRRTYNESCLWWSRNETDEYEPDELIMKRVPTGSFMAKEVSPQTDRDSQISNSFLLERTEVTLKTPDNVYGIQSKDIVLYEGERWIVSSVQKQKAKMQQTEFAKDINCSHYWYIELRK